ncbi:MAG: hypothetical protein II670_06960, partial [Alphaproteobacteria bacterium]|nr:hypothetical protein [Alphaproteobacteria bacterium]
MTDLKYFCLDDVRKLLSCDKKKRKKNKKLNDYYKYKEDRDEEKHKSNIYKFEKADQLKKAVESKGKLYRKSVKKQQKNYERAYKKYNKTYEKYQKEYNDKISGNTNLFSKIKNTIKEITPAGMYNLDMVGYDPTKQQYSKYRKPKFNLFVRDCYMYQFICGTRDFFVESVQNIDLREWGDSNDKRYYDHLLYNDLDTIYRTDDIKEREYVNFDQSYITDHLLINRLNAYNFSFYQEEKYDEVEAFECRRVFPNRVIYSIPDIDTNISDGWRKWLSGNSRNFNDEVVSIMPHGEHGAIMLFRNSAPIIFSDSAKLSNDNSSVTLRVTQGTGELFNQPMIHLDNVDSIEYGSCQDGFSAMSSPSGNFYVSQEQGKIFTFKKPAFSSENISELSSFSSGLNAWFKHYIPYMLTRDENVFAETKFELYDNTVAGIGYTTSYDNSNGIVYISKKDYRIKPEYRDKMTYFG